MLSDFFLISMYFVDNLNLVKRGETIRVGSITCMICFLYKRYKKKITTRDVHCWRYLYKITLYLLLTKRFVKLHPCHRNVFLINHNCSNCSFPCIADNAPVKDDCLAKMSISYQWYHVLFSYKYDQGQFELQCKNEIRAAVNSR